MLLIDGVKYEKWVPQTEDEFEQVVKNHTQDIFGEQSIYLDRKQKLKSLSGIGSIPDGFAIIFGDLPQWHIVEVELSSHPLDDHIASQVRRFITGVNNWKTQQEIAKAIYEEVIKDSFLKLKVEQAIKTPEIYKFLAELISKQPILIIIIEKDTQELREVLSTIRYPQEIKVVEFQTFTREGVGLEVHAHLFEPVCKPVARIEPPKVVPPQEGVKIKDLVDAGIIKVGQVIYRLYKGQRFEGKVLSDGSIELAHTGEKSGSPSGAAKDIAGSVDGWTWWYTKREDGTECLLDALREEFRATHAPKPKPHN